VTYLSGLFDKVEKAVPGVSGLSFVDDIGWLAEGKDEEAMAARLLEAAAASIEWAVKNGVASDPGKTAAAFSSWRRKAAPEATVMVGEHSIPFNKEATMWLRIWLD